jgi:hypothetical protein
MIEDRGGVSNSTSGAIKHALLGVRFDVGDNEAELIIGERQLFKSEEKY